MTLKNSSQINEKFKFPIIQVSGTNFEIVFEVGSIFKRLIRKAFQKSPFYIALKLIK